MMKSKNDKKQNKFLNGKTKVFAIVFICVICVISVVAILLNRYYQIHGMNSSKRESSSVNYISNFDGTSTLQAVQLLANSDGEIKNVFEQYLSGSKIKSSVKLTQEDFNSAEQISTTIVSLIETNYINHGVALTEENISHDDQLTSYVGNLLDLLNKSEK